MIPVPLDQALEFLEWLSRYRRLNGPIAMYSRDDLEVLARDFVEDRAAPPPYGDPLRFLLALFHACRRVEGRTALEMMEDFVRHPDYGVQILQSCDWFQARALPRLLEDFARYAAATGLPSELDGPPRCGSPDDVADWAYGTIRYLGPRLLSAFQGYVANQPYQLVQEYEAERARESPLFARPVRPKETGTEPLSARERPSQAATRLVDSVRQMVTGGFYDVYLAAEPRALHHLAALGALPEDLGQTLEFLAWLHRHHPKIRPDGDIPADGLAELVYRFCSEVGYTNGKAFANQIRRWFRGDVPADVPADVAARLGHFIRRLWPGSRWVTHQQSPLERYWTVKVHGLFLFLSSDDFPAFAREHWRDLNALTADELDIYYSQQDLRERVSGFETLEAFRSLPVEVTELPSLVLWRTSLAEAQAVLLSGLSHQQIVYVVQQVVRAIRLGGNLDEVVRDGRDRANALREISSVNTIKINGHVGTVVGTVNGTVVQGTSAGSMVTQSSDLVDLAKNGQHEEDVRAVMERWMELWAEQRVQDREATAQAIAQAIPRDKLGLWRSALANFIGSGGATATILAGELLWKHIGG